MTNPMKSHVCGAHARSTGSPCQKVPMANGRCRLHGGLSTGRPTTSGLHTKAAKMQRANLRQLIQDLNQISASMAKTLPRIPG